MSKQTFTPGPWEVREEGSHKQSIMGHWQVIDADKDEDDGEASVIAHTPWVARDYAAQNLANARLIAAAPDLLAACERVLRAIQWSVAEDRMSQDEQAALLRAAIAKATGA